MLQHDLNLAEHNQQYHPPQPQPQPPQQQQAGQPQGMCDDFLNCDVFSFLFVFFFNSLPLST